MNEQTIMKKSSLFSNIKNSMKYMIQSIQGKYSLETYLEVLSEFTDSEICNSIKEGLNYVDGEVIVVTNPEDSFILFNIHLEFQDKNELWMLQKAERKLEKIMFTQETIEYLEMNGEMKFQIEKPL